MTTLTQQRQPARSRGNGMMVKVRSATLHGVDAVPIEVEVDGSRGMAGMQIVGLPDKAVNEAKERVRTAIENSGYDFPVQRLTINLAPADIKKAGPSFDLPIAVGLMAVSHQVDPDSTGRYAMIGELALDGRVRAITGALPIVLELKRRRYRGVILPQENAAEAGVVEGIDIYPVSHLSEVVGFLNGSHVIEPFETDTDAYFNSPDARNAPDFADVKGHESVKRAVVVAAAGGHNMLMIGNPGVGKSMIARRIPGILPNLTLDEALETTKLYSIAGLLSRERPLVTARPFRAPHHTISDAGLVGGGSTPRPGEMSLSHHGVLFLDELPEFNRKTLEVMRQPLEDGNVTVSRASGSFTFPAKLMLIAAMNPCPCGYLGHPHRRCLDTPKQIHAYRNRISGPLLDRIDIQLEVAGIDSRKLASDEPSTDSTTMRAQVQRARDMQNKRFKGTTMRCNAHMDDRSLRKFAKLNAEARKLLDAAMKSLSLSPRAYTRIQKLARTIADLDGSEAVLTAHVSEAISYRSLDRGDGSASP